MRGTRSCVAWVGTQTGRLLWTTRVTLALENIWLSYLPPNLALSTGQLGPTVWRDVDVQAIYLDALRHRMLANVREERST